ncbi:MAG TPA: hypothetical protein VHH52_03785, partial [Pseudonocardiaceae bacterium]|nr:hypothetical protein [Pseudonocardiaceae bacterium]
AAAAADVRLDRDHTGRYALDEIGVAGECGDAGQCWGRRLGASSRTGRESTNQDADRDEPRKPHE